VNALRKDIYRAEDRTNSLNEERQKTVDAWLNGRFSVENLKTTLFLLGCFVIPALFIIGLIILLSKVGIL